MWILSLKDNQPWWFKRNENGTLDPITEQEYRDWRDSLIEDRDKIAAEVFDEFINKELNNGNS